MTNFWSGQLKTSLPPFLYLSASSAHSDNKNKQHHINEITPSFNKVKRFLFQRRRSVILSPYLNEFPVQFDSVNEGNIRIFTIVLIIFFDHVYHFDNVSSILC